LARNSHGMYLHLSLILHLSEKRWEVYIHLPNIRSFNSVNRRQASDLHNAPPRKLDKHTPYRHQQLHRHSDWKKNVVRPGKRWWDQRPRRRKEPAGIMLDKCFKHRMHNI
jgi:hypothetical protein